MQWHKNRPRSYLVHLVFATNEFLSIRFQPMCFVLHKNAYDILRTSPKPRLIHVNHSLT